MEQGENPLDGTGPNKGQKGRPKASPKAKALQKERAKRDKSLAALAAVDPLRHQAAIAAAVHLPRDGLPSKRTNHSRALARATLPSTIAVADYCPKGSRPRRPDGSINQIL